MHTTEIRMIEKREKKRLFSFSKYYTLFVDFLLLHVAGYGMVFNEVVMMWYIYVFYLFVGITGFEPVTPTLSR